MVYLELKIGKLSRLGGRLAEFLEEIVNQEHVFGYLTECDLRGWGLLLAALHNYFLSFSTSNLSMRLHSLKEQLRIALGEYSRRAFANNPCVVRQSSRSGDY